MSGHTDPSSVALPVGPVNKNPQICAGFSVPLLMETAFKTIILAPVEMQSCWIAGDSRQRQLLGGRAWFLMKLLRMRGCALGHNANVRIVIIIGVRATFRWYGNIGVRRPGKARGSVSGKAIRGSAAGRQ